MGFSVGSGGRVDPRVLAGLAATCHVYSQMAVARGSTVALDYEELSRHARDLGLNSEVDCNSVDERASETVSSLLRSAAIVVCDMVGESLDKFFTTYEEDASLLSESLQKEASMCSLGSIGRETEECVYRESAPLSYEMMTALSFRMSKKRLLLEVGHRLDVCMENKNYVVEDEEDYDGDEKEYVGDEEEYDGGEKEYDGGDVTDGWACDDEERDIEGTKKEIGAYDDHFL